MTAVKAKPAESHVPEGWTTEPAGWSPDRIREVAAVLGFFAEVGEGGVGLRGHGAEFAGSPREAIAFLIAWETCKQACAKTGSASSTTIPYSIMCASTSGTPIEPGVTFQIMIRPQRDAFRPMRIAVPDDIAAHFELVDLKIGNRSQFQIHEPLPCSLFSTRLDRRAVLELMGDDGSATKIIGVAEAATGEFGLAMVMDTAQTAMDITVVARLKPGAPAEVGDSFVMLFLGINADQYDRYGRPSIGAQPPASPTARPFGAYSYFDRASGRASNVRRGTDYACERCGQRVGSAIVGYVGRQRCNACGFEGP